MSPHAGRPAWADWATDAFLRAERLGRPILLHLTTRWAAGAALVDDFLQLEPLAGLLDQRVVAVRVDADERPDLAERYTVQGWPTLVFLTPAGLPLGLWPVDDVDARRFTAMVEAVCQRLSDDRERLAQASPATTLALPAQPSPAVGLRRPDPNAAAAMTAILVDRYDPVHGGFGVAPKFPHAAALEFALVEIAGGRGARLEAIVPTTLDAMATGGLRNPRHGGFHRLCTRADWSGPDAAVLLEVQADLLRLYADAALVLGEARYRDVAAALAGFVRRELSRPEGGFHLAWPGGGGGPSPDPRCFVGASARMASALIKAGAALEDGALVELAIEALERVVSEAYRPGAGLARVLDPRPRLRGLLDDQVAVAAALLEASSATGRIAYADLSEDVMRSTIRRFWRADLGALGDRVDTTAGAGDMGLLALPWAPLGANCQAASVLLALAERTADESLRVRAATILASFAEVWQEAGLEGAPYPLSCGDLGDQMATDAAG